MDGHPPLLGVVADDVTGGTDVAAALRRAGLRTAVVLGPPAPGSAPAAGAQAVVVALRTRAAPAAEAVARSLAAARWLRDAGAQRLLLKYCSTFDSTSDGAIGPVADALLDLVGEGLTVVVPSSPQHGRTQYRGHLFVGDVLLADSPMRHHPLTPMTDSRVDRLLAAQTSRPVRVVHHPTVAAGVDAVADALAAARADGVAYAVVDALDERDLAVVAAACRDLPLTTGAAGLAGALGVLLAADATTDTSRDARAGAGADVNADDGTDERARDDVPGAVRTAALAGSCSARTLEQVARAAAAHPAHRLDAVAEPDADALARRALAWVDDLPPGATPLVYSSLPPDELARVQWALGTGRAARLLEDALALVARGLVARGVRRLVVAGGESSGAVVEALGLTGGLVGPEAAPGVPWVHGRTAGGAPLALLLKSGNFGAPDLLARVLDGTADGLPRPT